MLFLDDIAILLKGALYICHLSELIIAMYFWLLRRSAAEGTREV